MSSAPLLCTRRCCRCYERRRQPESSTSRVVLVRWPGWRTPPSRFVISFGPGDSASKTAMNAMTLSMAIELELTRIKVNACSPGFIKTNLNAYEGTGTVEEGALEPVRLALLGPDGPTGTFTLQTVHLGDVVSRACSKELGQHLAVALGAHMAFQQMHGAIPSPAFLKIRKRSSTPCH